MDDTELIAELKALAPVPPERDLPGGRVLQIQERVTNEIVRTEEIPKAPPSRRRTRRWVAFALVPAALIGAAATYAATRSADEVVNGIGCYAAPRLDADTSVVEADGRDPVTVCAEAWPNLGGPSVPPLVACAMGQVVAVFPSDDPGICQHLGLDPLPADYKEAAGKFVSMRDDLINRFASDDRCVTETEGRQIARDVLDEHGFIDWSIHGGTFSDAEPCAELWFDSDKKIVGLVPTTDPALGAALSKALDPIRCSGTDQDVQAALQQALDESGFSDWRVEVGSPRTSDEPCFVSAGYYATIRQIVLGPGNVEEP